MKVRKAIIPAAGMGTRVLPASKAIPKEMLNIVDKPAIQYIVEEAFNSGIEEVLIITNRGKGAIEDHFDHAYELESKLKDNEGKKDIYNDVLACSKFGNIFSSGKRRQKDWDMLCFVQNPLSAMSRLRSFTATTLLFPTILLQNSFVTLMKNTARAVSALKKCQKDVPKYCSLAVEKIEGNCFNCTDMIEKPKPEQIMSNYSILGRVVLPPEILTFLKNSARCRKRTSAYRRYENTCSKSRRYRC